MTGRSWMPIGWNHTEKVRPWSALASDEVLADIFRGIDRASRPWSAVGYSMPEFEVRRERQGSILSSPVQREVLKWAQWTMANGMGAAKAARVFRRENLLPCQRAAVDWWKEQSR